MRTDSVMLSWAEGFVKAAESMGVKDKASIERMLKLSNHLIMMHKYPDKYADGYAEIMEKSSGLLKHLSKFSIPLIIGALGGGALMSGGRNSLQGIRDLLGEEYVRDMQQQQIDLANKMKYHGMRPFANEPSPKPGILSGLLS